MNYLKKSIKKTKLPLASATLKEAVQGKRGFIPALSQSILGIDVNQFLHNIDLFKYSLDYAEAIVNTVREPLVVLNKDLQVITANKAFYQTFDVLPEKIENKPFYQLGRKELDTPKFTKLLHRVIKTGKSFENYEIQITLANGKKRTYLLNARKFYRQINDTQTMLLAMEDITKAKDFELQKDEFASMVMHELKGPVSTISGYLHLLKGHLAKRGDQKLLGYTESMKVQVYRLTSLINGLLNSSRIRAVGFEFQQDLFEINGLIKQTIKDVQNTTRTHQIKLDSKIERYVLGDRERISQVLINLIINAIKYSPNASEVIVKTSLKNGSIVISVQDFGMGISKENQKKVFERFFKLKSTDADVFYGVGLGLDISSQIIRHHKGKIWIDNKTEKGSIFNFSLPVYQEPAETA